MFSRSISIVAETARLLFLPWILPLKTLRGGSEIISVAVRERIFPKVRLCPIALVPGIPILVAL